MKTCPICKTAYEDDTLEKCANEGAALETSDKPTPKPILPEVDSATADAVTSDIDVGQVKNEQKKPATATEPAPAIVTAPLPVQKPAEKAFTTQNMKKPLKNSLKNRWAIAFIVLIVLAACAVAFYFWFYKGNLVEVNLHSVPPGAEVTLDGKKIGTTPLIVRIKKGTHQVVFEQMDYQPVKEILTVTEDGHVLVKKMVLTVNPSPQ